MFNGQPAHHKTHHSSVAYVTQEDTHFRMSSSLLAMHSNYSAATLTVRETLQFSLECQAPTDMPEEAKNNRVCLLFLISWVYSNVCDRLI